MQNVKVAFHSLDDVSKSLKYAVVATSYKGTWIYCRHKNRSTWEMPGGHIEKGELPIDAASRELFEETGASKFSITPICIYGVNTDGQINYGMLCFADVKTLSDLPDMEIAEISFCDSLPDNLTYPDILPHLYKKVLDSI